MNVDRVPELRRLAAVNGAHLGPHEPFQVRLSSTELHELLDAYVHVRNNTSHIEGPLP